MNNKFVASALALLFILPAGAKDFSIEDSQANALHVLNRLAFGPCPGSVDMVMKMGIERYIEAQLHPTNVPEDPVVSHVLSSLPGLTLSADQVFLRYGPLALQRKLDKLGIHEKKDNPEIYSAVLVKNGNESRYFPRDSKILAAIQSRRQLQEVMTDFWFNHFNVFDSKDHTDYYVGPYEAQVIRRRAFGKFRDLLGATCHHPAMLDYLDNWKNSKPGYVDHDGVVRGLNENYAREVMELHTLGVDGGYTQKDVIELARILSGLTLPEKPGGPETGSGYRFDTKRHDFGDKLFLGHVIKGSGEPEIEKALDILADHPATAHHISYQLAQYFVCDNPPETLVNSLAQEFSRTHGDTRAVLTKLFHSREFWDSSNFDGKFKSPFRFAVSTIRAAGIDPDAKDIPSTLARFRGTELFLWRLGDGIHGCKTPDGFKNTQDAWLSANSLLRRIDYVRSLTRGKSALTKDSPIKLETVQKTVSPILSVASRDIISAAPKEEQTEMILAAPEAMRY